MKKVISIDGMSCEHCAASVKTALENLEEVKSAKVDLKKKSAIVKLKADVADSVLTNAVSEAGFTPLSVTDK